MDLLVNARIVANKKLFNLKVSDNIIFNNISSTSALFNNIYKKSSTNAEIYEDILEPVFDLFLNGMNISLFLLGDRSSGKSQLVCGDINKNEDGLFSLFLERLFSNMKEKKKFLVELEMFQISDTIITDLLDDKCKDTEIIDSVEFGAYIHNLLKVKLENYNHGIKIFKAAINCFKPQMASIIKIQIENTYQDDILPSRSQFIIIILSITKPLTDMPVGVQIQQQLNFMDQTVVAFSQLVASLANQQFPERVVDYQKSNLNRLLEDVMGGNCKTSAIVHLKDDSDPKLNTTLLHLAENLSKVTNYPVVNSSLVRKLLILYRSRALTFQKSGKFLEHNCKASDLIKKNDELKDEIQNLKYKLEMSQTNQISKPYIYNKSTNSLLLTRDEKYEIEKIIISLQMEKNTLLEERDDMQLSHKFEISKLKDQIKQLLKEVEKLKLDLKFKKELKNESNELPAKNTTGFKQKDEIIDYDQLLFKKTQKYQYEIEKLHNNYDNEIYDLQKKISDSVVFLNKTKFSLREEQKKNAKLTASLIITERERNYYEPEYHKMQNKLKMSNEDFRERLNKYVKDIANYVDSKSEMNVKHLQPVVDSMLADIHTAHKAREKQLSQAAYKMKNRLDQIIVDFERIITAYKDVYEQIKKLEVIIEIEPISKLFSANELQLTLSNRQQIYKHKLQSNKDRSSDYNESSLNESLKDFHLMFADMSLMHEQERAKLITKNALLDEEVKTLRDYINKNLHKFKENV